MIKKVDKFFPYLILISGLIISFCAAIFSIDGFAKFFAGASTKIMIVTGAMELCKLVITSALKIYWNKFSWSLKIPAIFFTIILIYLTSVGLYGFLSAAYQDTSTKNSIAEKEIELIESKKSRFTELKIESENEKSKLVESLNLLMNNLNSGTTTEYIDRRTGQKISSTSNTALKIYDSQINELTQRRDQLALKIDNLNDSINHLDIQILEKRSNNVAALDLGPLIYVQKITGWEIDSIANILILSLMIVFDPLAISMLLMAITILRSNDWVTTTNNDTDDVKNCNTDINKSLSKTSLNESGETDKTDNTETDTEDLVAETSTVPDIEDTKHPTDDVLNEIIKEVSILDPIIDLENYFKNQHDGKTKNDKAHKFYHGKGKLPKNK